MLSLRASAAAPRDMAVTLYRASGTSPGRRSARTARSLWRPAGLAPLAQQRRCKARNVGARLSRRLHRGSAGRSFVTGLFSFGLLHLARQRRDAGARRPKRHESPTLLERRSVPRARPVVSALIRPRSATTHTRAMAKRRAQPLDHREECGDVGGVARPHFRAHRSLAVDQPQGHLPKVRPMIDPCCSRAAGAFACRRPRSTGWECS